MALVRCKCDFCGKRVSEGHIHQFKTRTGVVITQLCSDCVIVEMKQGRVKTYKPHEAGR